MILANQKRPHLIRRPDLFLVFAVEHEAKLLRLFAEYRLQPTDFKERHNNVKASHQPLFRLYGSLGQVVEVYSQAISESTQVKSNFLRGCLKSWLGSKKSPQGISCKYVDTAPLRVMSKAYPSNLTDQFELISGLIPAPKSGGRPREVNICEILNAIFYVLCEGCRWRALPGDFPNWQTVYTYFRNWRKDGTWVKMHDQLCLWTRVENNREPSPSEAIVDSQSVKSSALVSLAVGYDAGKKVKGRKRFLTVDTLGLVLPVLVTAASVGERDGGRQVLKKVKQMRTAMSRLNIVWVDSGFDGHPFMEWVMDFCHWIVQVVIRPKERKGFVLLPKRPCGRANLGLARLVSAIEQRLRVTP